MAVMGRPTICTPEMIQTAQEYLDSFDDVFDPEVDTEVLPTIAGLSLKLKVARSTLHKWMKEEDKSDFSDIAIQILAKQETSLVNNGLRGSYNSSIAKLMLTKHGYSDKIDSTIANPDGSNLDMPSDIEIARKLAFVLNNAVKAKELESSDTSTKQT